MTLELLSKKNIAVLGLSKSGISTINFLKKKGFNAIGWDDNIEIRRRAKKKGIKIENLKKTNIKKISFLIVSPGIHSLGSLRHPLIKKADLAGIEIINDIELFFKLYPNSNCIGVTGTNGKSTTVSLLHHVFNKIKIKNSLGGNIGKPIFSIKHPKNGFYILEISSFQLELMQSARFKIGIILNITKDHLERHGSFKKYVSQKVKIFDNQQKSDLSVLGLDNVISKNILKKIKRNNASQVLTISTNNKNSDIYVKNNYLYISYYVYGLQVLDVSDPHNIFSAGFYDTYPEEEGGYVYSGVWGAFPYFSSDKVVMTDRINGLYVLEHITYDLGDIDTNGSIDVLDIVIAIDIIIGDIAPDSYQSWASDINGDGETNVLDVILLVNIILGISNFNSNGDMNQDGIINVLDIVALVNIILGGVR